MRLKAFYKPNSEHHELQHFGSILGKITILQQSIPPKYVKMYSSDKMTCLSWEQVVHSEDWKKREREKVKKKVEFELKFWSQWGIYY